MKNKESTLFQTGRFNPDELYEVLDNFKNQGAFEDFLKWRMKYKMFNYSAFNQYLLYLQAQAHQLTPVFKTLRQWNQEKPDGKNSVSVNFGQKASLIVQPIKNTYLFVPKDKYDVWEDFKLNNSKFSKYFKEKKIISSDDKKRSEIYEEKNGKAVFLEAYDKKVIAILKDVYNEASKEKIGKKEFSNSFNKVRNQFSIDQTNYPEDLRCDFIKRFETQNYNPEEGEKIYNYLKTISNKLGIQVVERNDGAGYTGFLSLSQGMIYVLDTMPVESRVSTLAHELGHYILQKNIANFDKKYSSSKNNYEIQAELFSKFFCSTYDILCKDTVDENGEKIKKVSGFTDAYISSYIRGLKNEVKTTRIAETKEKLEKAENSEAKEKIRTEFKEEVNELSKKMFYLDFNVCLKGANLLSSAVQALEEENEEKLTKCLTDMQNFQGVDIVYNEYKKNWCISKGNKENLPLSNFKIEEQDKTNTIIEEVKTEESSSINDGEEMG